jgi:transposase
MRQQHRAGEKMFVDYAGQTISLIDPHTGEVSELQVFVAALGASNYTYAEACLGQDMRSWINAHINAYEYFGGVPEITVPDNLKSGVTKPDYYDPDINPTYQELAEHYGSVIIPARVKKPRDKAKVENAVLQVERWVLAPLRDQEFFSLNEINRAIRQRLEWLNNRSFAKLDGSRRSLFEELDKSALKPLPAKPYEMSEWKTKVAVNIDYHVEFERHFYSVPYTLVNNRVDIRATGNSIECFFKGQRVASHLRSRKRYGHSTKNEHRPKSHQEYAKWPPSRLVNWARTIGPATATMVQNILQAKPHPEQGYRSCLGLLRLGDKYSKARLEQACCRALRIKSSNYQSVKSILKTGFDQQPLPPSAPKQLNLNHENIRGPDYYR